MRSAIEHASLTADGVYHRTVRRAALRRAWPTERCWSWLHDAERAECETRRDPKRRECWLLGRVLAKQVLKGRIARDGSNELHPQQIVIVSRDGLGRRTGPRVFIDGRLHGWCLSIAYSDLSIAVALTDGRRLRVGVDLVRRQPLGRGFAELWFSTRERDWTAATDGSAADRAATVWAIKEAFYKASNTGDRFAPGRIEVSCDDRGTHGIRVDDAKPPTICRAQTAISANHIIAIVTIETGRGSMDT
jgi:phosphopantetheinyl transferase